MDPIVEMREVGVSLGGRRVLTGVDLILGPGSALGVAGPNGSGKTTLVRALATLTTFDQGTYRLFGKDTTDGPVTQSRPQIGLIGHQPALIPELTLTENLEHVARLAGIDTTRVPRALDVVGLGGAADRRAVACSFGMQRRVEIAHLLLTKPRLLLLDEAASGLDDSARELIAALVASVLAREGCAVVVSHDRAQLGDLCDQVVVLEQGRLVAL
ncbi:MAG TPA: ABC transporter ATP-binding protein [Acidimicrobiia bacterium]